MSTKNSSRSYTTIKKRRNFNGIDPSKVPYLNYELVEDMPDFNRFELGSQQSLILRNLDSGEVEQICFTVQSDNGRTWPKTRRIEGEIQAEDHKTKHCDLRIIFTPDQKGIKQIAAMFCAPQPRQQLTQRLERASRACIGAMVPDCTMLPHP